MRRKIVKFRKLGAVANAILSAIADGIEIMNYAAFKPRALMAYGFPFVKEVEAENERRRISASVRRLKRRQFLREIQIQNERSFQLTALGESYITRLNLNPPCLPDGLQTLVSFDIPEVERKSRQAFRRGLRALGFRKLHASLWASERDWLSKLTEDIRTAGLGEWVKIMHGRVMETVALDSPRDSL